LDFPQRLGATNLDTYVSNAIEGVMDHDVQNVGEEVSTHVVE
jgi:hypothetical protein